ncbi:MAG: DUF58 domain-containing protein [Alphaproteobacteria bacterium]|nr:DUF58 domain-containing protein [Alphaproteobacteria bacterium]
MVKIKKISSKFMKTKLPQSDDNGLYATLDELMNMRKYVAYMQNSYKHKTYSAQTGDIKSAFKGRGIEMEEIREYHFGDDVRDIDWRVTARKEKPYTKIYMEEKDREIYVWLDLSQMMLFGSSYELKSVTASKFAALIAWIALNNKDRFGCIIFDGKNSWLYKAKNDRAYLAAVLKKISEVGKQILQKEYNDSAQRIKSLKMLQANIKNKASLFVISSFIGWNADYDMELAALAKKTDMYLINIFDKLEEKAPTAGQYMAQFGDEKIVFDSSSKIYQKKYADYFATKRQERKQFCRKIGCKMIDFSSSMSFINGLKIL